MTTWDISGIRPKGPRSDPAGIPAPREGLTLKTLVKLTLPVSSLCSLVLLGPGASFQAPLCWNLSRGAAAAEGSAQVRPSPLFRAPAVAARRVRLQQRTASVAARRGAGEAA